MKGLVYKSTGLWYIVRGEDGLNWDVRIKGRFKTDSDISSTNPLAVGDTVVFEIENRDTRTGTVTEIGDRYNYMVRVSPHNVNQKHIIAANIDVAVIVASIATPRTSRGFIDRFLVTAEAYHIPAIIIVNKADLLTPKTDVILKEWNAIYRTAGYEIYSVAARLPESLTAIKDRLAGKTALFSGHSGVGKSTLLNALVPGMIAKTKEVSGWSGKGQHTTTFAEMFDAPAGGKIIDTPGVKEFGIIDMEREELSHYFPEMRAILTECKFNNCLHMNEPGCAVKQGVMKGKIAAERYENYLTILDSIGPKWKDLSK